MDAFGKIIFKGNQQTEMLIIWPLQLVVGKLIRFSLSRTMYTFNIEFIRCDAMLFLNFN